MGAIFGDEEVRTVNIDLTTDEGYAALDSRAAGDARQVLKNWDSYAGVSLDEIADELTEDFGQESVSLPKSAFADPKEAGRELRIVRRTYRLMVHTWLAELVRRQTFLKFTFPAGHTATPPATPPQRGRQSRKQS